MYYIKSSIGVCKMSKQIFREKNISKLSSPEQLNDYLKVASPSIWVILSAIIIILIGVCVWGWFGKIETKLNVIGFTANDKYVAYVNEDDVSLIKEGMSIEINDKTYQVTDVATHPVEITEDYDSYLLHLGKLDVGDWMYPIYTDAKISKGVYEADIIIESISPSYFITN